MATLLDFSLLKEFGDIFPVLLVLVVLYAFFVKLDWFKESKTGAVVIATIFALMIGLSPVANRAIQLMAPFYVLFFVFLFFIMLSLMTLGADEGMIKKYVFATNPKEGGWPGWTIGIVALLIGVAGFGRALAEKGLIPGLGGAEITGYSAQETLMYQMLFHPKMMGMIFVLVVVIFTINRLAVDPMH